MTFLSVYRDHGVVPKDSREDNFNKTPSDLSRYLVVRAGDLVVNKMKAWQGSLAVSSHEGIVSPAYLVCSVSDEVHSRFIHYLLRSTPMVGAYHRLARGIRPSQWSISWEDLAGLRIDIPEYTTQRAIGDYLDAETARIDALIARKDRVIGLLRAREVAAQDIDIGSDVGFSAMGVPCLLGQHRMVRLGAVSRVRSGLTIDGSRPLDGAAVVRPYLSVANVQDGHLDLSTVKEVMLTLRAVGRFELRYGDVLMTEGGDPDKLGRGTVWRGEIAGCLHQNHIFAVRPSGALLPDFLALVTRSSYARAYFEATASKTTGIASTSTTRISSFQIPLPDLDEQQRIVTSAWERSRTVTAAVRPAERQIDLLREHRQALITAAVQGEIEIPGMARAHS